MLYALYVCMVNRRVWWRHKRCHSSCLLSAALPSKAGVAYVVFEFSHIWWLFDRCSNTPMAWTFQKTDKEKIVGVPVMYHRILESFSIHYDELTTGCFLASTPGLLGLLTPPFHTLSSEDLHENRPWFPASAADFFRHCLRSRVHFPTETSKNVSWRQTLSGLLITAQDSYGGRTRFEILLAL